MSNVNFKGKFYSPHKILTTNMPISFVIGARGVGKTYGILKKCVKDFKYKEYQFIYLRRHKSELDEVETLFDYVKDEFPNDKIEVKGKVFYFNGKKMGKAMALSQSQNKKSSGFPMVETIIFDEFMLEEGYTRYIPNEPNKFLNFTDTIYRNRDSGRAILLSNAVTMQNPYFIYFDLIQDINGDSDFYTFKNKGMCVEIPDMEAFVNERKKTRWGKVYAQFEYGKMSLENEFTQDIDTFVMKTTPDCEFNFSIYYKGDYYGVWTDFDNGLVFVNYNVNKQSKRKYAMTTDDHKENLLLVKNWRNVSDLRYFANAFKKGYLRFHNNAVRHFMMELIKNMRIY